MEDRQPTEAEAKELWEWCGVRPTIEERIITGVEMPDNTFRSGGRLEVEIYPPLDLNSLFRQCLPKVSRIYRHELLHNWIDDITLRGDDPALALFWALWQVKEMEL